jgi:hypothetical protein
VAVDRAVRQQLRLLRSQLDQQVQSLPPGNDAWADTSEELQALSAAQLTFENALLEGGA